jgi:hypothetical protein
MQQESDDVFSGLAGEFIISPITSKENSYSNLLKNQPQSKSLLDKNKNQI